MTYSPTEDERLDEGLNILARIIARSILKKHAQESKNPLANDLETPVNKSLLDMPQKNN